MSEFLSKEYLQWVLDTHGNVEVLSTNCNGKPQKTGDYVFNYGYANDLMKRLDSEKQ